MTEEQTFFQNFLTRIDQTVGEFSNELKKEIIDTLNILKNQNNDLLNENLKLKEQISLGNAVIPSNKNVIAAQNNLADIVMTDESKNPKEENSFFHPNMEVVSEEDGFFSTFRNQNWSLPNLMVYYMAKNPKFAKYYEKMVQSCKYFFIKNPILIVTELSCYGKSQEWLFGTEEMYDLAYVPLKVWVTEDFVYQQSMFQKLEQSKVSSIIPKIYQFNAANVFFEFQILSFNEFLFISESIKHLNFYDTFIKYEDGNIVQLEKLVEALVNLNFIYYMDDPSNPSISTKTAKNLLKIPHFSKTEEWELQGLTESFDIETLFNYAKTNDYTFFDICFCGPLSDAFKNSLVEINAMNMKHLQVEHSE